MIHHRSSNSNIAPVRFTWACDQLNIIKKIRQTTELNFIFEIISQLKSERKPTKTFSLHKRTNKFGLTFFRGVESYTGVLINNYKFKLHFKRVK